VVDEREGPGTTGDLPDLAERSDISTKRVEGCEPECPRDTGHLWSGPDGNLGRVAQLARAGLGQRDGEDERPDRKRESRVVAVQVEVPLDLAPEESSSFAAAVRR
jgi:hypothetical protein